MSLTFLGQAIELYLQEMQRNRKSENTIRAAKSTLVNFRDVVNVSYVSSIREQSMQNWAVEREAAGHTASTLTRERSVLRSFFDFCIRSGYYTGSNPVESLVPVAKDRPKAHLILSTSEMLKMLELANPVERIALAVGMNTGLRASDIVSLKVGDVDLVSGYISTTIQKTKGVDRKPITWELHQELQRWFDQYAVLANNHSFVDNDYYLIPSYTRMVSGQLVVRTDTQLSHPHRLVQRMLKKLDLPTAGEGFHTLRRSSATALVEKIRSDGAGTESALMVAKEYLNHQSITQTEVYLDMNPDKARRDDILRGKPFLTPPTTSEVEHLETGRPLTVKPTRMPYVPDVFGILNQNYGVN